MSSLSPSEQQNYWHYLEEASHLYVIRTDLMGHYTYVNRHFRERFQFESDTIIGSNSLSTIIPEDHAKTITAVQTCLETPSKAIPITLRKPLVDSVIWTDWEFIAVPDEQGQPVEILCIGADASARQRANEELELARKIIDTTLTGVVVCLASDDYPVIDANPAFEAMTGYTLDDVWGRNMRFLQGDDHDQPELAVLKTAIHEGKPCAVTLRNYRKNGEMFYNELHLTPIYSAQGKLIYFTGLMLDVTQRVLAEQEIAQLKRERERVRSMEAFLEEVAHDIKTPFSILETTIYLMSKLSNRLMDASDVAAEYSKTSTQERKRVEVKEIADNLHRRVDSLQSTVEHLRDLTNRLKKSTLLTEAVAVSIYNMEQPYPLNAIVEQLARSYAALAEDRKMTLRVELDEIEVQVRGDKDQLSRAVQNLVDNAFKYTADGGMIWIRTRRQDRFVLLEVEDTGVGIPDVDLPNVFKRRFRTEQAVMSPIEGTGLGLAIARQIVEDAGGSISVRSTFGKGSTFSILLPAA
jgi:PAS domain S-box-containing protein